MSQQNQNAQKNMALNLIHPDPNQPRKKCKEAVINAIAESAKVHGIRNPITVRPHPEKEGQWMIVHGETRWRGAKKAALEMIQVRMATPDEVEDEITRIMLQAADNLSSPLTPIDWGNMYATLRDTGLTIGGIEKVMMRNGLHKHGQSAIKNLARIAKESPQWMISLIESDVITASHAKIMLNVSEQIRDLLRDYLNQNKNTPIAALEAETLRLYIQHYPRLTANQFISDDCSTCPKKKNITKNSFCLDSDCHTAKRAEWHDSQQTRRQQINAGHKKSLTNEIIKYAYEHNEPLTQTDLSRALGVKILDIAQAVDELWLSDQIIRNTEGLHVTFTLPAKPTTSIPPALKMPAKTPIEKTETQGRLLDEHKELQFDQSDCKKCSNWTDITGQGQRNHCSDSICFDKKHKIAAKAKEEIGIWILTEAQNKMTAHNAKIIIIWALLLCPTSTIEPPNRPRLTNYHELNISQFREANEINNIGDINPDDISLILSLACKLLDPETWIYHLYAKEKRAFSDIIGMFNIRYEHREVVNDDLKWAWKKLEGGE